MQCPVTQNVCSQIFRESVPLNCPLQDANNIQYTANPLSDRSTNCIQIEIISKIQQIHSGRCTHNVQFALTNCLLLLNEVSSRCCVTQHMSKYYASNNLWSLPLVAILPCMQKPQGAILYLFFSTCCG